MILAVDIGGTKVNVALFKEERNTLSLVQELQFKSQDHPSFKEILQEIKKQFSKKVIEKGCFGIAGPVINEKCITTNLPWSITKKEITEIFQTDNIALLNDLEATAYGMLYLDEEKFFPLNEKGEKKEANKAVIAAGTGLGEAQLFFDTKKYHPIGCEGGHTDFAPQTSIQDELLKWLRKKFPSHVSYERILCGKGIFDIYQFLCEYKNKPLHKDIVSATEEVDRSALITKLAIKENDNDAIDTLKLFSFIYGAEAGNLALKSMSLGGVYIGGGIAPKILPILKDHFMDGFLAKGRFQNLLEKIEVKISLDEKTALLGAAYFARDRF